MNTLTWGEKNSIKSSIEDMKMYSAPSAKSSQKSVDSAWSVQQSMRKGFIFNP